jgi:hypothetical protein
MSVLPSIAPAAIRGIRSAKFTRNRCAPKMCI